MKDSNSPEPRGPAGEVVEDRNPGLQLRDVRDEPVELQWLPAVLCPEQELLAGVAVEVEPLRQPVHQVLRHPVALGGLPVDLRDAVALVDGVEDVEQFVHEGLAVEELLHQLGVEQSWALSEGGSMTTPNRAT